MSNAHKSAVRLDELKVVTTLLQDVYFLAEVDGYEELSETCMQRDISYVSKRHAKEGLAFLTDSLPRLGKALHSALLGNTDKLRSSGFQSDEDSILPTFLNGLFKLVLSADGGVLPGASPQAIRWISQICFVFYKLDLPIPDSKKRPVLDAFVQTERELDEVVTYLSELKDALTPEALALGSRQLPIIRVLQCARNLLAEVFRDFRLDDCYPCHGPGAVAGREQPWEKWHWTAIPARTHCVFPLEGNFYSSFDDLNARAGWFLPETELSARVILVPKDSRGPRLISSEPKEFQYLQQGVMRNMVQIMEKHPLTRNSVFFTNQRPNQVAALLASERGVRSDGYSTLDLKEASDRVTLVLAELLLPEQVFRALYAVRSNRTVMPDGQEIVLKKHAPMGSATCFPTMAACIWAILTAGYATVVANDPHLRRYRVKKGEKSIWLSPRFSKATMYELEGIHVYGDDVVVPIDYTDTATALLTRVGLVLNPDKCCTNGFFRESCGVDAFKGVNVTPQRISCNWNTSTDQQRYTAFCEYSSRLGVRYHKTGAYLAGLVRRDFPSVPCESDVVHKDAPSLLDEYVSSRTNRKRWNRHLQRWEIRVLRTVSVPIHVKTPGRVQLLRFFNSKSRVPLELPFMESDPLGAATELSADRKSVV